MVFVADDLGAWLVGLLADAGRRKLTTLVLGTDQERALRRAATAAVQFTAAQLAPSDGERTEQLALVVNEVFGEPMPNEPLAVYATLLQAMQAGIAEKLAVLDDASLTGTGQSSAEVLGVSGNVLAATLAGHLIREIVVQGSHGRPLAPLANQLNHDVTHLQGERLEGMLAELADQVRTLARAYGPVIPSSPIRLLPRPAFLVGREELLADLGARLTRGDSAGPQIVVLCGLGGVGKTSVAVEYAHGYLAEVGLAWQFASENSTVLAAEFGELAAQLGIPDDVGTRDPVATVHGTLAAFAAGWLLVFDNAPNPGSIERFLPPAGPGQVLITSQNPNWPHGQTMQVPLLSGEVAGEFLVTRTGDQDRRAAQKLAIEMDGLPLALEQAAAYILATGDSLAGYLSLFLQQRTNLLARGEPTGYHGTVMTTWALAFTRLEEYAPEAAGLLRLLSFCAPDAIPLRLLLPRPRLAEELRPQVAEILKPLLENPLATKDAIASLRRYSLITPAADGSVSIHRLVQAVTADQMPPELADGWRQATSAVVEAAIPPDPEQPYTWSAFAALLPHALALLTFDSIGMSAITRYLGASGSHAVARDLQRKVVGAQESKLGAEHPDALAARSNLAYWTGMAGDVAGARDQYAALLSVIERVSGSEQPDTLITRGNFARWAGAAGDAAGARDQFAALLPLHKGVFGPEHPSTLTARANLAHWAGMAGDAVGARDQFAALVPLHEWVHGPEHPDTLTARGGFAFWSGEAGDVAGARDQYAGLLPEIERVLGPEHPETLTTRGSFADFTAQAGDAAGARDQYAALVPVVERVSGAEHPDTLIARANLAQWTGVAGDAAGARDQFAALLPLRERVSAAEHPETLTARANLARWTGEAGDASGACGQFAALLPEMERFLGPQHPDTLTTRGSLSNWIGRAGDAAGARDQVAALLPLREQVSGSEHPATLIVRSNLAGWTGEAGDAAGARDQFAVLVPVSERVSGAAHPDTLTARTNLARWTGVAGDAAGARDQFAVLVPVMERVSGAEHPGTLTARGNLAGWTGEAGDAAGARDQFAVLVQVMERVYGAEYPETLTARANLARWTGEAGDAAEARDQYAALHAVRKRVSGPRHPDTLAAWQGLARWTGEAGDAAGARDLYTALLAVRMRVSGPQNPATRSVRVNLAYWTLQADEDPSRH